MAYFFFTSGTPVLVMHCVAAAVTHAQVLFTVTLLSTGCGPEVTPRFDTADNLQNSNGYWHLKSVGPEVLAFDKRLVF